MQYGKTSGKLGLSLEQQVQVLSVMCNNFPESGQCPAKIIGFPECPHYYSSCDEIKTSDWEFFLKDGRNCALWPHFFKEGAVND